MDNSNVLEGTSAAKSNLSVKKTESGIDPEEISKGHVLEALQNTSRVIQDIESLLASAGK